MKGNAAISRLPIDLTLLAILLVVLAFILYLVRGHRVPRAVLAPLLLWVAFIPGALLAWSAGQGTQKMLTLFTVTLMIAVLSPVLLQTRGARHVWLNGVMAFGALLLALSFAFPDTETSQTYGRLVQEGGTTITTGQLIGAGGVVALLSALGPGRKHRVLRLTLAAILAAGVLLVGSRGPFLALLLALTVTLLFGRAFVRSRPLLITAWAAVAVGAVWFVFNTDIRSAARIANFFANRRDLAREYYFETAMDGIVVEPAGFGWGGFAHLVGMGWTDSSSVPAYPHNLFLEVFLEGGWVAGVALVLFVLASLLRLWRRSGTPEGAMLLGLAVYWLVAAQTSSDVNGNRMMWASLALAFVTIEDSELGQEQEPVARPRVRYRYADSVAPLDGQGFDQAPGHVLPSTRRPAAD